MLNPLCYTGLQYVSMQAQQVIEFSAALTDVTKLVAEHWADGPDSTFPPGHWFRIGMEAATNQVRII